MNDIPESVKKFVEQGYDRMACEFANETNLQFERYRMLHRKWRNLVSEAKFDIPPFLHEYINFTMPEEWDRIKTHRINNHDFLIKIPGFLTVAIIYKTFGACDWCFAKFEILHKQKITSSKYGDLPLFLAMARELAKPRSSPKVHVDIEEIDGGLAENAKLIKVESVKPKSSGYVLTEYDFYTENPYSDMPIYA